MAGISGLVATGTIGTGGDGELDATHTFPNTGPQHWFVAPSPGLHVIDIDTGGNDFKVTNMSFVVDGPVGALVVFRLPGTRDMLVNNSNVLVGSGGIGMNNVMFYTDQDELGEHFNFNNTILNGVAFWSLAPDGGRININNAQGYTQLVADTIDLDDVRFTRCQFTVPEPSSLILIAFAGFGLVYRRRAR